MPEGGCTDLAWAAKSSLATVVYVPYVKKAWLFRPIVRSVGEQYGDSRACQNVSDE